MPFIGIEEPQFLLLMAAMISITFLLVLWIILRLETKMRMIDKKLDAIAENSNELIKMGLRYFGGKK